PVDADHDHFLPDASRHAAPAAEPVVARAQSRGAGGRHDGRALQRSPSIDLMSGCASHETTSARVSSRLLGVFSARSPTTSALPSMYSGTATPKRFNTVGAMSMSRGFSFSTGRLQNRMPGTSDGSTQ